VRPALALVLLAVSAVPLWAQLPADGRTSYSRNDRIRIPFELRSGGPATKVVLYYSFDGGAWQEKDSAKPGQKREFIFQADREGPYSFATMTYFNDGTTDPPRKDQLTEQRRVVIDKTPPKILSFQSSVSADGAPGVEWDVSDDYMDPKGIKLEFQWPEMSRFEQIDKNVPFGPRDSRHWQMKPTDRMQVRLTAIDRAGNKTVSDPIWISGKDGTGAVASTPKGGGSVAPIKDKDPELTPAAGTRAAQPTLHYVNTKSIAINVNATTGPSGLTKATLWMADDKLVWKPVKEVGPKPAPPSNGDKERKIPLNFVYEAENDGVYNFVIIVESHRGPNKRNPKTGESGDVQVVVDTTKPDVQFVGTPRVTSNGDRGAVVDIRWKATDANIAQQPIMLEYQAAGDQAWKSITPNWVDNTGQFTWAAPTGEHYEFLIRVRCRDRAGNEASSQTVKPVNIDLTVPGVDGVDVAPGSGRGGAGAGALGPAPGIDDIKIGPVK
jgi:hypothetical protein